MSLIRVALNGGLGHTGAYLVPLTIRRGWHPVQRQVWAYMTLPFLPPYSPELMPMERVWA